MPYCWNPVCQLCINAECDVQTPQRAGFTHLVISFLLRFCCQSAVTLLCIPVLFCNAECDVQTPQRAGFTHLVISFLLRFCCQSAVTLLCIPVLFCNNTVYWKGTSPLWILHRSRRNYGFKLLFPNTISLMIGIVLVFVLTCCTCSL